MTDILAVNIFTFTQNGYIVKQSYLIRMKPLNFQYSLIPQAIATICMRGNASHSDEHFHSPKQLPLQSFVFSVTIIPIP